MWVSHRDGYQPDASISCQWHVRLLRSVYRKHLTRIVKLCVAILDSLLDRVWIQHACSISRGFTNRFNNQRFAMFAR